LLVVGVDTALASENTLIATRSYRLREVMIGGIMENPGLYKYKWNIMWIL